MKKGKTCSFFRNDASFHTMLKPAGPYLVESDDLRLAGGDAAWACGSTDRFSFPAVIAWWVPVDPLLRRTFRRKFQAARTSTGSGRAPRPSPRHPAVDPPVLGSSLDLQRHERSSQVRGPVNSFTPKSDQFPQQPHQKYYTIPVWRTWLFIAYSDGRLLYWQF